MVQRGIEAASQRSEDGDICPRRRSCKRLRTTPHLTVDETNPSIRARDLRNAEWAAQKSAAHGNGDLHELPRQSRLCNLRSGERQYINTRNRGFVRKNPCLLDYLRQGHSLRRHNPESRVYRPDGDCA